MRTKEDILKQMEEEMPFEMIGKGQMPYILEAMEIYAQEQVKNIAYEPVLANVNLELKETYLRRIRTAYDMLPNTSEEQKQRLLTKVSCYRYFIVELER